MKNCTVQKQFLLPRLYDLSEVQNVDHPLRRILDLLDSPYHSVAKWLAGILKPVRKHLCTYSLRDTLQFIDYIQDMNVANK
ncbi:unnamed protein product, partial [Trichobilharzia regenti]